MSGLADSSLFDSAVHHLFHLPEVLEKLASAPRSSSAGGGGRGYGDEKGSGSVPVDILEYSKEYTFLLDVPGLSKSDIQVMLEDEKILVIKGNGKRKRDEVEDEGCKYLRLERRATSKFVKKFRLPDDVNISAISAKCENGLLIVVVGKSPPPEVKAKKVEVKIA